MEINLIKLGVKKIVIINIISKMMIFESWGKHLLWKMATIFFLFLYYIFRFIVGPTRLKEENNIIIQAPYLAHFNRFLYINQLQVTQVTWSLDARRSILSNERSMLGASERASSNRCLYRRRLTTNFLA